MTEPAVPSLAGRFMPRGTPIDFDAAFDVSTLKDKSVLVTGGASGIGLACAKQMAEAGALVTISDLQSEAGLSIAQDLSSKGLKVNFVQCDVTSYASQVSTFKSAFSFGGGKIDIVVPAAGIIAQKNLFDMVAETALDVNTPPPEPGFSGVDVNLKGVYYSSYLALHYFRFPRQANDSFKKSLVLIASFAGYMGFPSSATYSISKFGVRGLFWGLRAKAAEQDPPVRVNLVAPWVVDTPLAVGAGLDDSMNVSGMGMTSMETVVEAVVRLAVDEEVSGRSVACMPTGNVDVRDEAAAECGGTEIKRLMLERIGEAEKKMKEQAQAQAQAEQKL